MFFFVPLLRKRRLFDIIREGFLELKKKSNTGFKVEFLVKSPSKN